MSYTAIIAVSCFAQPLAPLIVCVIGPPSRLARVIIMIALIEKVFNSVFFVKVFSFTHASFFRVVITLATDTTLAITKDTAVKLTAAGAYVVTVAVTDGESTPTVLDSKTYKFTLGTPVSASGDSIQNLVDYAIIKAGVLATDTTGFAGGIFSGDLTGDLTVNASDYAQIIKILKGNIREANYGTTGAIPIYMAWE